MAQSDDNRASEGAASPEPEQTRLKLALQGKDPEFVKFLVQNLVQHFKQRRARLAVNSARRLYWLERLRDPLSRREKLIDELFTKVPPEWNSEQWGREFDREFEAWAARVAGLPHYDELFREIAAFLIFHGQPLPGRLRAFICEPLLKSPEEPRRKSGPDPEAYAARNAEICAMIALLNSMGFDPTRNEATQGVESACSIVKKALEEAGIHLSEGAVEKIWQNNRRSRPLEMRWNGRPL
jgi:hypothetical protein